jgi:hypothetical protein
LRIIDPNSGFICTVVCSHPLALALIGADGLGNGTRDNSAVFELRHLNKTWRENEIAR